MMMSNKTRADRSKTTIKDLYDEILIGIFMCLNVIDLVTVSKVCQSWNHLVRHPSFWEKIDLTGLDSSSFNIPSSNVLNVWDNNVILGRRMMNLLKYALSLSNGSTTCLIFNYRIYLTDDRLIFVAQRTPNLKRLVLQRFGHLSKRGIDNAMSSWRNLESITITPIVTHSHIFSAIEKYCKNIVEVKFTANFEWQHAESLVKFTPNLKMLNIRNIRVSMKALTLVLNSMKHLEFVNLCHSAIFDTLANGHYVVIVDVCRIDDVKARFEESLMRKLIFCDCDEWWCEDEIPSLSH